VLADTSLSGGCMGYRLHLTFVNGMQHFQSMPGKAGAIFGLCLNSEAGRGVFPISEPFILIVLQQEK